MLPISRRPPKPPRPCGPSQVRLPRRSLPSASSAPDCCPSGCSPARPLSAASSENRGASWVHPTVSGAPSAAIARKRSSSARHSWVAVVVSPRQPRLIAPASRGIVSSQEQIGRCLVESVIALTISCSWTVSSGGGRNWPELPRRYSRKVWRRSRGQGLVCRNESAGHTHNFRTLKCTRQEPIRCQALSHCDFNAGPINFLGLHQTAGQDDRHSRCRPP